MSQASQDADHESTEGKGKAFFDRADQVVETGNWDYAIEMYLEGIRRERDNIERGHQPLRKVAMNRTAQGGKGPGLGDRMKHGRARDPLDKFINAEYLLAKEPGSIAYMERFMGVARALDLP